MYEREARVVAKVLTVRLYVGDPALEDLEVVRRDRRTNKVDAIKALLRSEAERIKRRQRQPKVGGGKS